MYDVQCKQSKNAFPRKRADIFASGRMKCATSLVSLPLPHLLACSPSLFYCFVFFFIVFGILCFVLAVEGTLQPKFRHQTGRCALHTECNFFCEIL